MHHALRHRFFLFPCLAALLASCGSGSSSHPLPDFATLAAPGRYEVASRQIDLFDASRPTPANGSFAGASGRRLPAIVWYPRSAEPAGDGGGGFAAAPGVASDGPFPVVGYAHGFTSSREESRNLGSHLASHGYVVVAVTFPLSNGGAPGGPTIGDMTSQPGDLDFAMLEVGAGAAGADLAAAIDASRRGIVGLSLGGGTVLIGAYHPKWRIADLDAAVAFAPASCFFGPGLFRRALPLLILAGDADMLVPYAAGPERSFDYAPAPATLARFAGGNHVGFLGIGTDGPRNADALVGCPVIGAGGANAAAGAAKLAEGLIDGAGPDAVDATACGAGICEEEYPGEMSAARQLELTRAATLAHLEAHLRGRGEAEEWLRTAFAKEAPDVEVTSKR